MFCGRGFFVLIRVIILPENYALALSEKQGIKLELVSYSQLNKVNLKKHFALSFIKDKGLNSILRKYLRPYIEAMIDINKYEYKPTDYIVSVPNNFSISKSYIALGEPCITTYMKDKVKQNQLLSQDR